jgi:hypothetical protein
VPAAKASGIAGDTPAATLRRRDKQTPEVKPKHFGGQEPEAIQIAGVNDSGYSLSVAFVSNFAAFISLIFR